METFINNNLSVLDKRIKESEKYIELDRNRFKKYYELIEDFVKQQDMIIEDESIIHSNKSTYDNYSSPIVIFTNNIIHNSFTLSNLLAKQNPYVTMHTVVPYRVIQIKVEGRLIAILNKHMLIRKDSCSKLCQYYNFIHKNNLSYSPPEYFMIRKYSEWYQSSITEDIIKDNSITVNLILKNIDIYIKSLNFKDIEKEEPSKERQNTQIFIEELIKKNKLTFYRETPIIGCIANNKERNELIQAVNRKYLGRKIKLEQGFIQDNYDIRIRVFHLYIDDIIYLKLYNISEYEIIPRRKHKKYGMYEAHPYVCNRLLLIDFISSYYLCKSVENSKSMASQATELFKEITGRLEYSINCNLEEYNDYTGEYSNKNIDKNIYKINAVVKDDKIMTVYTPIQYKNRTGSFKEINAESGSCR